VEVYKESRKSLIAPVFVNDVAFAADTIHDEKGSQSDMPDALEPDMPAAPEAPPLPAAPGTPPLSPLSPLPGTPDAPEAPPLPAAPPLPPLHTFTRRFTSFVTSAITAVFGAGAVALIVSFFTRSILILSTVATAALLFGLYLTVFSENIHFEVEGDQFRYFKRKQLQQSLRISEYQVGYHEKTGGYSTTTRQLNFQKADGSEPPFTIDIAPIGQGQFYELWALLDARRVKDIPVVKAAKTKPRLITKS
jgi:hypothetical protein